MQVRTVNYKAADAAATLTDSLLNTGFAVLENHPISADRLASIYDAWGRFFASDTKHDFLRDPVTQDGFFPFKSEHAKGADKNDRKEFYHVYPWGKVPEELAQETRTIYADLMTLGIELLSWIDAEMDDDCRQSLTEPLAKMMESSEQSLLRILHYPPVDGGTESGAIRAAAHEDINLITLLVAGSKPGLQAMDKSGQWQHISCDAGMITINNGDMLSLATGGVFPSTTHRVVNPDAHLNQSRYSMPMFLHPRPEVELQAGFSADDFLQQRLKEIGLK